MKIENESEAVESGIKKLLKKQLKKEASKRMSSSSIAIEIQAEDTSTLEQQRTRKLSSLGSSKALVRSSSVVRMLRTKSIAAGKARKCEEQNLPEHQEIETEAESKEHRAEKIERLLDSGRKMIKREVFAIPKVLWASQDGFPDERKAMDRAGFLIESYHAHAWWWEIYEMVGVYLCAYLDGKMLLK